MRMLLSWGLLALLATGGLTAGGCGSKETKTPTASIPGSGTAEGDQADGDRAGAAPIRRAIIKSPIRCIRWCKSTPRWAISP